MERAIGASHRQRLAEGKGSYLSQIERFRSETRGAERKRDVVMTVLFYIYTLGFPLLSLGTRGPGIFRVQGILDLFGTTSRLRSSWNQGTISVIIPGTNH